MVKCSLLMLLLLNCRKCTLKCWAIILGAEAIQIRIYGHAIQYKRYSIRSQNIPQNAQKLQLSVYDYYSTSVIAENRKQSVVFWITHADVLVVLLQAICSLKLFL